MQKTSIEKEDEEKSKIAAKRMARENARQKRLQEMSDIIAREEAKRKEQEEENEIYNNAKGYEKEEYEGDEQEGEPDEN